MLSSVFGGIAVRVLYAIVTAFLVSIVLTPWMTRRLTRKAIGQSIREEGVKSHQAKGGIPTMGGIVILVSVVTATLFWARLEKYTFVVLFVLVLLGAVGFVDDLLKVLRRNSDGLSGKGKLLFQTLVSVGLALYLLKTGDRGDLFVPLLNWRVDLGWLYVPFVALVVVGSSNAVNLTDGLDGLAAGILCVVCFSYAGIAYIAGNSIFSRHLGVPYLPGTGELAIFCAALLGGCAGFLWYNAHPASIFMGDTGSLALGGALGAVAVLVKEEVVLVIIGGIFVIEALSVMIQVFSFKTRGKRVFKMSPIHHHFELCGWAETKVVIRFWLVTVMLALIGISILGLNAVLK